MRRSHPVVGAFLLAGFGVCAAQQNITQESSEKSQSASEEYKITPEAAARVNPVKSTPEGLADARKAFKYDCEMCHGAQGDGKGELVESMKLAMHDWHDPASLAGITDGEIFYIVTKGKGKMMGEGDRQPEKLRWNLVNLVRSFAAKGAAQKAAGTTANP
jgi:cbb3-type cytochrome c oxidase subunit III